MKKYCLNCMREITTGMYCPDCASRNIPKIEVNQLKPGTVLNGKYLVGTVIDENRYSITYLGKDLMLEKKVAIKEFYPIGYVTRNHQISSELMISSDEQREFVRKGIDRFLDEARNAARFSEEPGMVTVKDFFKENATAYVVKEYLEGRTLASCIRDMGVMESKKAFHLMLPVIDVLDKMHKTGVIHCGINPDNIMYSNKGTLKLTNYRLVPEESYTSMGEIGPWTDVYGVCATIYKCITGITPGNASGYGMQNRLKYPSELGVNISPKLERVLMYGLAPSVENRCKSMNELLHLIQDGLTNVQQNYTEQREYRGSAGYADPSAYGRKNEHPKKNKWLVPLIIAGSLMAFALVAGLIFYFLKPDNTQVTIFGDYYITGCKDVMKVRETEDKDSKVLAKLDNGEKVSLVEKGTSNYWKVYVEAEDVTGYIDYHYLTNESDAAMDPLTKYVNVEKDNELTILSTPDADGTSLGVAERGEEVTVLAMPGEKYVYIYATEESAYGYVERSKLSEEKPVDNADVSAQTQNTTEILGAGNPPSNYQGVYYVNVEKGYLALRNAKAFDTSNEIGKMYNGDYVYAIKTNELYWYVYCPSLGAYGYTNSDYLVSSYSSVRFYDDYVYYAHVTSGYLALRNAKAYDASNEIGKIANGQEVDVIYKETGGYWYVYVPALNKYGYVNSEYLRK